MNASRMGKVSNGLVTERSRYGHVMVKAGNQNIYRIIFRLPSLRYGINNLGFLLTELVTNFSKLKLTLKINFKF